ncbi:NmrA-like family protein [Colletotrichum asianum]
MPRTPCLCALRPGTGSQRRGLSRDLSKIPLDLRQELEGIEVLHDIRDQRAIERAVSGVDAVLLLLRAAETASVKIFHARSWM